jgi:hypothetical protein
MTELKKIFINDTSFHHELRLDWENDRHQSIKLEGLDAKSVEEGLFKAADLLKQERHGGCI